MCVLQAEVSQLEGHLSSSESAPFPPYVIPDSTCLCTALSSLKKLAQSNRTIIVIPLAGMCVCEHVIIYYLCDFLVRFDITTIWIQVHSLSCSYLYLQRHSIMSSVTCLLQKFVQILKLNKLEIILFYRKY